MKKENEKTELELQTKDLRTKKQSASKEVQELSDMIKSCQREKQEKINANKVQESELTESEARLRKCLQDLKQAVQTKRKLDNDFKSKNGVFEDTKRTVDTIDYELKQHQSEREKLEKQHMIMFQKKTKMEQTRRNH